MDLQLSAALSRYAYHLAGGGYAGVLAALESTRTTATAAAGLVAGASAGEDLLARTQATELAAGAYGLEVAGGGDDQALQDLLRLGPETPEWLPVATDPLAEAGVVAAEARYAYLQALRAGQGQAFALATAAQVRTDLGQATRLLASAELPEPTGPLPEDATPDATPDAGADPAGETSGDRAPAFLGYARQDADQDGLVSALEFNAYAARHPGLAVADANQDGQVTPAEGLAYGLAHPSLDPADTNFDGVVSGAEALAYELAHPELALRKQLLAPALDVLV